jgi:hypothetical protein
VQASKSVDDPVPVGLRHERSGCDIFQNGLVGPTFLVLEHTYKKLLVYMQLPLHSSEGVYPIWAHGTSIGPMGLLTSLNLATAGLIFAKLCVQMRRNVLSW